MNKDNKIQTDLFEHYGYHMSMGKRDGLVFPLAYAELLTENGSIEGEMAVAVMRSGSRRLGFYTHDDRFVDMRAVMDPDQQDIVIERDYRRRGARPRKEEDEIESIIGTEFVPSTQLRQAFGCREGRLPIREILRYATQILRHATYQETIRRKSSEPSYHAVRYHAEQNTCRVSHLA